jgi:SAM-dependent methyltransferase
MSNPGVIDFENYQYRAGASSSLMSGRGGVHPLCAPGQIDAAVPKLRAMLERDKTPAYQRALKGRIAEEMQRFGGHWFQRIDFADHSTTSTSNPAWAWHDEGGLNTLGKRLTSLEASVLRPWPKWLGYLIQLMPDVRGKSVLELGSSNGFFSFRFAEMGASHVTGIEAVPEQSASARWAAQVLGHGNVNFLNTDFLVDHSIEAHDIVFLSEVQNHFLFPFAGLAKIVNLAKELVIFDTGAIDTPEQRLQLHTGWDPKSGALNFHSFTFSDGLLMDYLALLGVPAERITRYKAPAEECHILYAIDTRSLSADRRKMQYLPYLWDALELGRPRERGTYPR